MFAIRHAEDGATALRKENNISRINKSAIDIAVESLDTHRVKAQRVPPQIFAEKK